MIFLFALVLIGTLFSVEFKYHAPYADSVFLAGTFNGWNSHSIKLEKGDDDTFRVTVPLKEGTYKYKFVINGNIWREDPSSESFVPDGFGGRNSILVVKGSRFPEIQIRKGDGIINRNMYQKFSPLNIKHAYIKGSRLFFSFPVISEDIDSLKAVVNNTAFTLKDEPFTFSMEIPENDTVYMEAILYDGKNSEVYYRGEFTISQITDFKTPDFLDTTVFYQIFPERFYNGDTANDPDNTRDWQYEEIGTPWGWDVFYGGDLEGVEQKLYYLKQIGVNAIYFNPIFTSPSNHKYNTTDYFHVDTHFGGDSVFFNLLEECYENGIKIILDGVFNHTADQHPFFKDVREKGHNSPYYDYYIVKKWPFPERFTAHIKPIDYYECWWGFGSLPKLNYQNPEVVKYILNVAKYWEERGIDGFRLDVPNEVPHFFWQMFRDTMKHYNREFYIVGEIWDNPQPWLNGKEFDGTMNYPLRNMIINLLNGNISGEQFTNEVKDFYNNIPEESRRAMLNILSTHDTRRIKTEFNGDIRKVKLAYLLAFTMPGVPCIYYGDEIGMEGRKDPDSRRVFPWDSVQTQKSLLEHFVKLVRFRKAHPCFSKGEIKLCGKNPLCIERKNNGKTYRIYINLSERFLKMDEKGKVIFNTGYDLDKGYIKPYGGLVIDQ